MFEKEAEEYACEYARQYLHNDGSGLTNSYCETYNGYYRGANDGYNKAKEEMQEIGLALQSDMDKTIEQNIQLKKQNNWLEGCKLELAEHLGKANDKISELEQQIEKMKCCMKCEHWYYYKSFCNKDNSYHPEGHSCEHFILRR